MPQNPRTDDIRTPRTLDEADSAIDLCEEILESIENDLVAKVNDNSFNSHSDYEEWVSRTNAAKKRWTVKSRELRYYRSRIKAGETPQDVEIERLKIELNQRDERIRTLNQTLKTVREQLHAAVPEAAHLHDGEKQNRTG